MKGYRGLFGYNGYTHKARRESSRVEVPWKPVERGCTWSAVGFLGSVLAFLLWIVFAVVLSGCGGYSVKLVHEPSTYDGLELIREDVDNLRDEAKARYQDMMENFKPWVPVMEQHAASQGKEFTPGASLRDMEYQEKEFNRACDVLSGRIDGMALELQDSLAVHPEHGGNLEDAGLFGAGAVLGALAVGAL